MPVKPPVQHHEVKDQAITLLLTELMEAWNAHDFERVAEFYAPDYEGIDVAESELQRGPAGIQHTVSRYLEAFPDLHFTLETAIVQGDRVALVWTAQGTHQGKWMNIPPTGRVIVVRGVSVLTLREGQVWRGLYVWDVAGLLRAIGLLPEL